jgi:hypothetical protein
MFLAVAHRAVLHFAHSETVERVVGRSSSTHVPGDIFSPLPAGGSRQVPSPLGRIQAEALVNFRAQCLFVVRTQTPNVILAGSDVHYPHIESTPKCHEEITSIHQRIGGDRLVTRIALDLERYVLSRLRHLNYPSKPLKSQQLGVAHCRCYSKDLPHSMQEASAGT